MRHKISYQKEAIHSTALVCQYSVLECPIFFYWTRIFRVSFVLDFVQSKINDKTKTQRVWYMMIWYLWNYMMHITKPVILCSETLTWRNLWSMFYALDTYAYKCPWYIMELPLTYICSLHAAKLEWRIFSELSYFHLWHML